MKIWKVILAVINVALGVAASMMLGSACGNYVANLLFEEE